MLRHLLTAGGALLAGLVAAVLVVSGAHAANSVESSTPAADAELTTAPTQLQLTFVEALGEGVTADAVGLALTCGNSPVALGPRQIGSDGRTVVAPVTQIAPVGTCNVSWRLPDGSTGSYAFKVVSVETTVPVDEGVEEPTATTQPPLVDVEPVEPPNVGGMLGLTRLVAYLTIAALFGGLLLIALAWPEGIEYLLTLRFLRSAWLLALVSSIAVVVFETARATGDPVGSSLSPATWTELLGDNPGRALLIRLLLVAAVGWVALRPERVIDPSSQPLALGLPALTLATYGLSRTNVDLEVLGYLIGAVHALAMGVWVGGLALVSRVVLAGPGDEDLVHAVRGFGKLATPAILVTVVTGVLQVYRLDGTDLFGTNHGRLVIVKVLAVVGMVYVGTLSRRFILGRLSRADHLDPRTAGRLRRAISTELLIGVLVLGLTSWMLASRPANVVVASPAASYQFDRTLGDEDFQVRIGLSPAQVGANGLRVELLSPESVTRLTVRLVPQQAPGINGWEIRVPLSAPGAATLDRRTGLTLGAPGVWNIEITGEDADGLLPTLVTALIVPDPTGATVTVPVTTVPVATLAPVTAPPSTAEPVTETTAGP
jgi:copper transport protein